MELRNSTLRPRVTGALRGGTRKRGEKGTKEGKENEALDANDVRETNV